MKKNKQEGFTYIEVMCAMVILLIGILAQLSALSFSILRQQEAEQQNTARQMANSTLESIFAARDLGKTAGINSWEMINTSDVDPQGLFVPGWNPVRQNAGKDGIQGTKDDACPANTQCQSDNYTNSSALVSGFERQIIITDVQEADTDVVKKRRLEVKIRYNVGQIQREQSVATIIADLPFYK
jgi:prepilin-type N-terminal cleavage/methylation domain-containing protein